MEKNVYLVDGKVNPCDVDYKSALCVDNVKTTRKQNLEFSKIPGV